MKRISYFTRAQFYSVASLLLLCVYSAPVAAETASPLSNDSTSSRAQSTSHKKRNLIKPKQPTANLLQTADEPPGPMNEIEMFVGETRVLSKPNAGRLAVGNGSVVSAAALDDKEILLIGNNPGISTLHIWTRDGRNSRLRIQVMPGETSRVTKEITQLLSKMPNVSTVTVGDRIVIEGKNLTEEQLFKLDEISKRYPQVVNLAAFQKNRPFEKMVLMDIKVVEMAKNKARDLGVRWNASAPGFAAGVAGDIKTNPYFRVQSEGAGVSPLGEGLPTNVSPFRSYFGIVSAITSQLALLERDGDAAILADPQLAARSGKSATFLVGGEIPYQSVAQDGAVSVQFKKFGVEIEIEPVALESGVIHSRIKAKVSDPDSSINPATAVPGLRSREAETWFNVQSGETMVLAGLLQKRAGQTVEKVPGLGDIPLLGHLFKVTKKDISETELIIFVTPTIVDPATASLREKRENLRERVEAYINPPAQPQIQPTPETYPNAEQYRGGGQN